MAQIVVYSRALCVQCGAVSREINKNIDKGLIGPSDVLIVMADGSPRDDKKVHPDIEVQSPDPEEQERIRKYLVEDLKCAQAPVAVLREDDGSEVEHFTGFRPDRVRAWAQAISVANQGQRALATA